MTDRELLEAAAKAAGLTVLAWLQDGYPLVKDEAGRKYGWDPLGFDSDALRLAVKLGNDGQYITLMVSVKTEADPYAATRRAIVRAAAAMAPK